MNRIRFAFWNLQNFFDTDDDPISQDFEFTRARGWTPALFEAKKRNLAAVLDALFEGATLDLLAVCEIEKDAMLQELVDASRHRHLRVVMDPSGTSDLRGIDTAVAFNPQQLEVVGEPVSHLLHLRYRTRDILEVRFRVRATGELFVLLVNHWPSRSAGKWETEALRIAVAENLSHLLDRHLKVSSEEYLELRSRQDLEAVRRKWDTKILLLGDFNDEPFDRSLLHHLKATGDLDRVVGETNDIDKFEREPARYREQDFFLFNASWRLLAEEPGGSYFLDRTYSGKLARRYQLLDQVIASRGLLLDQGLHLDRERVRVFRQRGLNATRSWRPKPFDRQTQTGSSDHFPVLGELVTGSAV